MGIRLFVGSHAYSIQGERDDLAGDRMLSSCHRPQAAVAPGCGLLDSGAFSDPPEKRLAPAQALERQLAFERAASGRWGLNWQAHALVSYDRLIDEVWIAGERHKRRWSIREAELAVRETIEAAHYLASQRKQLAPRKLILACQGVDAFQYEECMIEVLKVAQPDDCIGLGGWCLLGRWKTWLPTFWATLYRVLPRIAGAGVKRVHIFGVLYLPALGGLLWLADKYGLNVSTDSSAPILSCTRGNLQKAGARASYWRDNVEHWRQTLLALRASIYYRKPPEMWVGRQENLFAICEK